MGIPQKNTDKLKDKIFGIEKYEMRLSLHDPDDLGKKYIDGNVAYLENSDSLSNSNYFIHGK